MLPRRKVVGPPAPAAPAPLVHGSATAIQCVADSTAALPPITTPLPQMVTKYKLGYDPVEVDPEDMVRLPLRCARCGTPAVRVGAGWAGAAKEACLGSSCC